MGALWTPERIAARARELGPWFHNLDLQGVRTAPEHFLGDFPQVKWARFAHCLPADMRGLSVLDIGCNGGFYSIEMKRRGAARVLGIDFDEDYLRQARFAAEVAGADVGVPTALGLRRGRAAGDLRRRVLHRRVLPLAPPAARTRPDS